MESSRERPPPCRVVGVAVQPAKWRKHFNDTLLRKAKAAGFELRLIDPEAGLEEQGPFDAVLQKLRRPEWERQLERYADAHPDVKIFDRPLATVPIRHRGTMLSMLDSGGWVFEEPCAPVGELPQRYLVSVPTNTTLREGSSFAAAAQQLQAVGLRYPLLAKPVWADGREGSHALAVVGTQAGLRRLVEGRAAGESAGHFALPVLLQQYVDHGGCLFKVYVLGSTVVMVKRSSLQLAPAVPGCCAGARTAATAAVPAAAAATAAKHCNAVAQQPSILAAEEAQAAGPPEPCLRNGSAAAGPATCALHADARVPGQPAAAATAGRCMLAAQLPTPSPPEALGEAPLDLELVERVSAYPAAKSWGKWDLAPKGHGVASPPMWLIRALAQRLRQHLGLNLFNFDVIVPQRAQQQQRAAHAANGAHRTLGGTANGAAHGLAAPAMPAAEPSLQQGQQQQTVEQQQAEPQAQQAQQQEGQQAQQQQQQQQQQAAPTPASLEYHLIDINYFPGYEKLPGYEDLMVQFLGSIWAGEAAAEGAGAAAPAR